MRVFERGLLAEFIKSLSKSDTNCVELRYALLFMVAIDFQVILPVLGSFFLVGL